MEDSVIIQKTSNAEFVADMHLLSPSHLLQQPCDSP
jgi:hypothetical protein